MAKLCSNLGTTPPTTNMFPMNEELFDDCFYQTGLIAPDQFGMDMLGVGLGFSIHGDIQKIASSDSEYNSDGLNDCFDDFDDIKPEIRNRDCMWSVAAMSNSSVAHNNSHNSSSSSSNNNNNNNNNKCNNANNDNGCNSAASSYSDSIANAVPFSIISGNSGATIQQQQHIKKEQHEPPTLIVAKNNKLSQQQLQQQQLHLNAALANLRADIKIEPKDDYDYEQQQQQQQQQQHSIATSLAGVARSFMSTKQSNSSSSNNMQHIPPGTSLLRKSNNNNNNNNSNMLQRRCSQLTKQQLKVTAAMGNSNSCILTPATPHNKTLSLPNFLRPDTPHSLDDDISVNFRGSVDLRACVMGSNNISLTTDESNVIDHLSRELQNTSKIDIDLPFISNAAPSLADVLDVIHNHNNQVDVEEEDEEHHGGRQQQLQPKKQQKHLTSLLTSLSSSSDYESDDGECSMASGGSMCESSTSIIDGGNSSNSSSSHYQRHMDHSYTRCEDISLDNIRPNLETPSDSDEEIDVVSIGDKKLPTNPSVKDCRMLQTKVAHKFSAAAAGAGAGAGFPMIVKNAYGVRSIPPRRRGSYELPYTPVNSSPVKSLANSLYPSPASTPFNNGGANSPASSSNDVAGTQLNIMSRMASYAMVNAGNNDKSRKRFVISSSKTYVHDFTSGSINSSSNDNGMATDMPPSKKYRSKKPKQYAGGVLYDDAAAAGVAAIATMPRGQHGVSACSGILEEADTIEKRNLHNDMERQRRIGLKNLFEALKKQIPSIKDKERAPKVNILREAAKLCENLTHEDRELNEQRVQLREQLKQRQELLARLQQLQLQKQQQKQQQQQQQQQFAKQA